MRRAALILVLLCLAGPALAQKMYNREGAIFASPAALTPGDCLVVDSNTNTASFTTCPGGGGGSGDITDVWTTATGNVNALTAAAGDSFDAGLADTAKPCRRSTTLPGTCSEGECFQDTDVGGSEFYVCTATNTWTKALTGTDIDTSAELLALVTNETGTGQLVFGTTPVLDQPFITDYSLAGHSHTSVATGGTVNTTWTTTTVSTDALTAASGDSFNATAADSSKPCKEGPSLPGTCGAGECFRDNDEFNVRLYWCIAVNTWIPLASANGPDYIVGTISDILTGERVLTDGPGIDVDIGTASVAFLTWVPHTVTSNLILWDSTSATRTLTAGLAGATDPVLQFTDGVLNLSAGTLQVGGVLVAKGSGDTNRLVRWSDTAGGLTNSIWSVDSAGLTTASTTQTGTSGAAVGLGYTATLANTASSTAFVTGVNALTTFSGTDDVTTGGGINALSATASNAGTDSADLVDFAAGGTFFVTTTSASPTTTARGASGTILRTGTGSITTAAGGYFSIVNAQASGSIGTAYGIYIADSSNSGTITNDFALVTAGKEPSKFGGPVEVLDGDGSYTADGLPFMAWDSIITQNFSGSRQTGIDWHGTIMLNDNPSSVPFHGFLNRPKITNQAGEARSFNAPFAFQDSQNIESDGAASTAATSESFAASPVFTTVNSGTLTVTRQLGFSCSGTYGAGVTMTERNCYRAGDPNTLVGTIQTNVGVIVEPLTATVASIGMRNMDTMIFTPKVTGSNNPVTAGTAIVLDGTVVELTASGNTTMTATPTIADPGDTTSMNGQWVTLCNADSTDTITLNSGSSYNLQLRASTVALAAGQCLQLLYNTTKGLWLEADLNSAAGAGAGSGTDGHLVRWDVANALQDSTITVSDLGELVSAVTASTTSLGAEITVTNSGAVTTHGIRSTATTSGAATSGSTLLGVAGYGACATSNTCMSVTGVAGVAQNDTTGTITQAAAVSGFAFKNAAGPITTAYGVLAGINNLHAGGTITTGYGIRSSAPVNTGTIGTYYGAYVDATTSGTISTPWSIYSAGAPPSHFSGPVETIFTSTSTAGAVGNTVTLTDNHASGTPTFTGVQGTVTTGGSAAADGSLIGGYFSATCASLNACDAVTGVAGFGTKSGAGAVTPVMGGNFGISNLASGDVTAGYGVFISAPLAIGGGFGTTKGLFVAAGYEYAIQTNGTDISLFAGPVLANTDLTTPVLYTPRVELTESASDPTCIAGQYALAANSTTPRVRQCVDGTIFNVGKGDVVGPASSTDNAIARFDGTTGQLLQNTAPITISDGGTLTGAQTSTDTTSASGITYTLTQNHSSGGPTHRALYAVLDTGSGSASGGIGLGVLGQASCSTTNGCASMTGNAGLTYSINGSGTMTTAIGVNGSVTKNNGGGVITTAYGGYFGLLDFGGANAIATGYGVYIADSVEVTAITTDWALYTAGTESSRFGGPLGVGINPTSGTQLHVTQGTVGNEVLRIESVATNDDPANRWVHSRATAAASTTTNIDLDLTASSRCPTSNVCVIEATTRCHCTSGSSCTTNQGGGNQSMMTVKNNAGTISIIGAVTTPMASQIDASLTSLTLSVSAPNARMAVVVPANYAHTCHVTWQIVSVGT